MKQPSFIDSLESQREYVKACQRGYGYTRHGNRAHYLFTREQVEPSILRTLDKDASHFIFTFVGCTMESATECKVPPIVTPIGGLPWGHKAHEWTMHCPEETYQ